MAKVVAGTLQIKARLLQGVTRRVDVDRDAPFPAVVETLAALFRTELSGAADGAIEKLTLTTVDAEGDVITISSEGEWKTAVADFDQAASERTLKVFLTPGHAARRTTKRVNKILRKLDSCDDSGGDDGAAETAEPASNVEAVTVELAKLLAETAKKAARPVVDVLCSGGKRDAEKVAQRLSDGLKTEGLSKVVRMISHRPHQSFVHSTEAQTVLAPGKDIGAVQANVAMAILATLDGPPGPPPGFGGPGGPGMPPPPFGPWGISAPWAPHGHPPPPPPPGFYAPPPGHDGPPPGHHHGPPPGRHGPTPGNVPPPAIDGSDSGSDYERV